MDGQGTGGTRVLQGAWNLVNAEHGEVQQWDEHVPVGASPESTLQEGRAIQIPEEKARRDGYPVDKTKEINRME